jgi:hypothetical protein
VGQLHNETAGYKRLRWVVWTVFALFGVGVFYSVITRKPINHRPPAGTQQKSRGISPRF